MTYFSHKLELYDMHPRIFSDTFNSEFPRRTYGISLLAKELVFEEDMLIMGL